MPSAFSGPCALPSSHGEPVVDLRARLLNLGLLGLRDGVLVARVRLRDQVVLTALVFHDAWERLLLADVQLESEVLGHQEVLPTTELSRGEVHKILLRENLGVRLALENDRADRYPE